MIACTEGLHCGEPRSPYSSGEPFAIGFMVLSAAASQSLGGASPQGAGGCVDDRDQGLRGAPASHSSASGPLNADDDGSGSGSARPRDDSESSGSGRLHDPQPDGGGGGESAGGNDSSDDDGYAPHPWFPGAVLHREAPPPESHAPSIDPDLVRQRIEGRGEARERRIDEIFSAMRASDPNAERFGAILAYDFEHAPLTTNAEQLATIGIEVPKPGPIESTDSEVHGCLWTVIYGLTRFGIYLVNTDHLADRRLLEVLSTRILRDQVRDSGCSTEMSEFIDLHCCPVVDPGCEERPPSRAADPTPTLPPALSLGCDAPDGLTGPYEQADCDDDATDPWDQGRSRRAAAESAPDGAGSMDRALDAELAAIFGGPIGAGREDPPAVCARDRLLPMPMRGGY